MAVAAQRAGPSCGLPGQAAPLESGIVAPDTAVEEEIGWRISPSACQVRGRAIPCSDCGKQRHDITPIRLALTAEESVSGVTGATAQVNQETPPMSGSCIAGLFSCATRVIEDISARFEGIYTICQEFI